MLNIGSFWCNEAVWINETNSFYLNHLWCEMGSHIEKSLETLIALHYGKGGGEKTACSPFIWELTKWLAKGSWGPAGAGCRQSVNVHRKQNQNPVRKLTRYGKLQILSPTRKTDKQEMKENERRRGEVGRDRVREGKEGERKKRQLEKPGWETTSQGIFGRNQGVSWKDCHLLYFGLLKPCHEGNGPIWLGAVHTVLALQAKGSQFWVPRTKVKNKTNNKVLMVA